MVFVRRLIWDNWNVTHIARHQVIPEEVEEVCQDDPTASKTYAGRIRIVGFTRANRMLTIILAPKEEGIYYPVTARPADRKERKRYKQ